jgi:hypothetical protein
MEGRPLKSLKIETLEDFMMLIAEDMDGKLFQMGYFKMVV